MLFSAFEEHRRKLSLDGKARQKRTVERKHVFQNSFFLIRRAAFRVLLFQEPSQVSPLDDSIAAA
jgi:hypothetical protein